MNILIDITPDEFNQIRGNLPATDTSTKVDATTTDKYIHLGGDANFELQVRGDAATINALDTIIRFINRNCIDFAEGAVLDKLLQLSDLAKLYAQALPKELIQQ